jgi:DNA-binding GntR family transcriptional regulator
MPTSLTVAAKATPNTAMQEPKQSIRERVYRHLRDKMRSGEITYEDKLVDHEIASQLGVSRMPVREALLQLKSEGFLEGTSRGFVLRRFTPTDIANIFETRLLLEPAAAGDACKNASIKGLSEMRSMVAAAERAYANDDIPGFMDSSDAFRLTWVGMVPNPHLVQTIDRLRDHVEAVRLATLRDKAIRELALKHMKHILDAFLEADAEAVKERVAHNMRVSATCYYSTQETILSSSAERGTEPLTAKSADL